MHARGTPIHPCVMTDSQSLWGVSAGKVALSRSARRAAHRLQIVKQQRCLMCSGYYSVSCYEGRFMLLTGSLHKHLDHWRAIVRVAVQRPRP